MRVPKYTKKEFLRIYKEQFELALKMSGKELSQTIIGYSQGDESFYHSDRHIAILPRLTATQHVQYLKGEMSFFCSDGKQYVEDKKQQDDYERFKIMDKREKTLDSFKKAKERKKRAKLEAVIKQLKRLGLDEAEIRERLRK